MRMRPAVTSMILFPALLLTACGGDGDGTGGGSKGPIKLVGLWEIKGESAAAVNDYNNAAQLALERINAAGGIAGRQVRLERVPADPLNPQKATSQFLQAVDKDPVMLIGFSAASSALSSKSQIDRAGIPLIATTSSTDVLRFGGQGGSEWMWVASPYDGYKNEAAVRYATENLKVSKIGLLGTNESYGQTSIKGVTAELRKRSLEPTAVRSYPPTATDLTQQVLAMKGSDAIISFTYPNPMAVQVKQMQQNGMDIPTISSSANIAVQNKLIAGKPLERLYSASTCSPFGSKNQNSQKFGLDYRQRYGIIPSDLSAKTYDAFWIAKAAIEKAGSTEPEAIQRAMNSITVNQNVVCAPEYKSDGSHFLSHHTSIDKFAADGTPEEAATYSHPPLEAAKG